ALDEVLRALEYGILGLSPRRRRLEVRIERARDGELDVIGGHLHAVVEEDALAQLEGPDLAVAADGRRPGCQIQLRQGVAVEPVQSVEQRAVDQPPVLLK